MNRGVTVWLTGVPGAGKTTIANALSEKLRQLGGKVQIIDGDDVRKNVLKGALGFSQEDRDINVRFVGYVCKLLTDNGMIAIASLVSPYRHIRKEIRESIGNFVEVYVKCILDELIKRDHKGLYSKALRGEIPNFTGISDPYEEPINPEVVVSTCEESVDICVAKIIAKLRQLRYLEQQQ